METIINYINNPFAKENDLPMANIVVMVGLISLNAVLAHRLNKFGLLYYVATTPLILFIGLKLVELIAKIIYGG